MHLNCIYLKNTLKLPILQKEHSKKIHSSKEINYKFRPLLLTYPSQFDGSHIVSGSLDTSIRVWDANTGSLLHTLIGRVYYDRLSDHNAPMFNQTHPKLHLHSSQIHLRFILDSSYTPLTLILHSPCLVTLILHSLGHQSLTSGMELKHNTLVSGNADSTVKVSPHIVLLTTLYIVLRYTLHHGVHRVVRSPQHNIVAELWS